MQFGPNEDFAHYPRTPREDERMLAAAGCDLMFMPDVGGDLSARRRARHARRGAGLVAHPRGRVPPRALRGREHRGREAVPHRRAATSRCSARRTSSSSPSSAAWWRTCACRCEIIGAPTVRDADGLAMSSRNQYLTAAERALRAAHLRRRCVRPRRRLAAGDADFASIERAGLRALESAGFRPDYFAVPLRPRT